MPRTKLNLLPYRQYGGVNREDPLQFYYWPVIGRFYRLRLELSLDECKGGDRVLEVGFGAGLSFLNLKELYKEIHGVDLTSDVERVKYTFANMSLPLYIQKGNVMRLTYPDDYFDTVLLVSILEHLRPQDQERALGEVSRVLKPAGQAILGVPVERRFMVRMFAWLGVDIRKHHFSTDEDVMTVAANTLQKVREKSITLPVIGKIYRVGHFIKSKNASTMSGSKCFPDCS